MMMAVEDDEKTIKISFPNKKCQFYHDPFSFPLVYAELVKHNVGKDERLERTLLEPKGFSLSFVLE